MTLTDPREALADQSPFIGYLMGLVSLGQVVRALAADDDCQADKPCDADDFVHLLLGIAGLGASIGRLAATSQVEIPCDSVASSTDSAFGRWLR